MEIISYLTVDQRIIAGSAIENHNNKAVNRAVDLSDAEELGSSEIARATKTGGFTISNQ